jgi:hypothetical protein
MDLFLGPRCWRLSDDLCDGEYLGGGDIFAYETQGRRLALLLQDDFLFYFPKVVKLFFQMEENLPGRLLQGSSTGSQFAVATLLLFFTNLSFHGASTAVALWAFSGQLAIYDGLRCQFPRVFHRRLLFATLLVPSVLFWSSGMLKESV